MFVMFGWLKEGRPLKAVLDCYCYVCQRQVSWNHWRETEWVTLFRMKTIPFLSKDSLVCSRCNDEAPVKKERAPTLLDSTNSTHVASYLEEFQLASKSEVQRNFLLSSRASREGRS